jgi:DNA-binding response OmpR family regulator
LTSAGYEVFAAMDGQAALELIVEKQPDLVLLDVMMPGMDGFEVLDRIREFSNLPVIMLTAKGEEANRVEGLNRGADDYVVKPFSATELLARVNAVLRRSSSRTNAPPDSPKILHKNLTIDVAKAEVSINDQVVLLSATEYRLLLQFAHNMGETLSAEYLLKNVWGDEYSEDKEILWVCISRLRQKLESDPKKPEHIITRSGVGYLMPG